MADTLAMTIHVSPEKREYIRKKVEGGEYASESDVFAEGVDILREQEEELRQWEQENVVAAYDELHADPSSEITFDQLLINLEAARRKDAKAS